ncbi:glycogen synthase GlgA [Pirellulales bacterium]|nr:glycogen synthase GlgA [Pirellulales bacterium]
MKILFATSEAAPFAKTGGLGDVCGSLPRALAELGHQPIVIMPAFRTAYEAGIELDPTGVYIDAPIGQKTVRAQYLRAHLPGSDVPVILVDQLDYYDRPELYREEGVDYQDNCERFAFFCRAALEAIPLLGLDVDLIHCHDWCAGLIPAYLKTLYADCPPFDALPSIMTIHNLAYQGNFWHWDMALTGIDWKHFNWQQMEFYGNLSFLKTGLVFADAVTTVSPSYAREIQHPPLACGFEGTLQQRAGDLSGIINGVDYDEWSPENDSFLADLKYDASNYAEGKAACKADLQARMQLPVRHDVPLLATVGRLADQKGFDLIVRVMREWAEQVDAQWVLLGSGEPKYHTVLAELAEKHPQQIAVRLEFSNELAHRIEAGADMFLMPSQYEPCGLNQLYSLKYGTVPVVRATGGLADTVIDANDQTMANGTATGFCFNDYSALALSQTLHRAMVLYGDRAAWNRIIETGMQQDWSWDHSAAEYADLYQRVREKCSAGAHA